ncbi:MAG: hypothetical protein AAF526_09690 [Pseudomonadota bacterium]
MADYEAYDVADVLDFTLAYFVWCHSMREWVINDGAMSKDELDKKLNEYPVWAICRDIANRCRHFDLNRNPKDKYWSVTGEYDQFHKWTNRKLRHVLNIYSGQDHYHADALVHQTFRMWEEVLEDL